MNSQVMNENNSSLESTGARVGYVMFRFQSFLEQLEQEFKVKDLPLSIRDSYVLQIAQGKISFYVHPDQTDEEVQKRLAEIAAESFGSWLDNRDITATGQFSQPISTSLGATL